MEWSLGREMNRLPSVLGAAVLVLALVSGCSPTPPQVGGNAQDRSPDTSIEQRLENTRRLWRDGRYAEALKAAESIIDEKEAVPKPLELLEALRFAAGCRFQLNERGRALVLIDRSRMAVGILLASPNGIFQRIPLLKEAADTELLAANALFVKQDYETALPYFLRALEYEQAAGESARLADLLFKTSVTYFYLGKSDKSLEHALLSLEAAKKADIHQTIAGAEYLIGYIYRDLNKYDLSLEHFRTSLEHADLASDRPRRLMALNEIGNVLSFQDKNEEALRYKEQALKESKEFGDPYLISNCLNDLGVLEYKLGYRDRAVRHFEEAYEYDFKNGHVRETAISASNLATIFMNRGEHLKALSILEKTLPAVEKSGLLKEKRLVYSSLLEAHLRLGNKREALVYLDKDKEAREAVFNEEMAARSPTSRKNTRPRSDNGKTTGCGTTFGSRP